MLSLIDLMPLWMIIILSIVIIFLSAEIGYRIGRQKIERGEEQNQGSVGAIVGAMLGLLAFMLAFTFGMAASRYETKRMLVLEESNVIGTTYLRAGFLDGPDSEKSREMLREYVDIRVKAALTASVGNDLQKAIEQSGELQNQLWAEATNQAKKNPTSVMLSLYIQSLNEMIDISSKRIIAALWSRIPHIIWMALYIITILAMISMGYMLGIGRSRSLPVMAALSLGFVTTIFLIASLDHPIGMIKVSQQAMLDLQRKISI